MPLMKAMMLLLLLVLAASPAQTQEQTLIDEDFESGGYGGPVVKLTTVDDNFAVMVGGYGGWLINHTFMIGGGGYGLVTRHRPDPAARSFYGIPDPGRIEFAYGGGMLEVILRPATLMHSSISLLVGGGHIAYLREGDNDMDMDEIPGRQKDAVFVLEPSVNAELNVTTFFRINAGASYRFVSGISIRGLKNSDVSGASINLTFKFGKF
jgi:hypothetical protein